MAYLTISTALPYQFIITKNFLKFLAFLFTTTLNSASTFITLTDQTRNFKRHSIPYSPCSEKKTPLKSSILYLMNKSF